MRVQPCSRAPPPSEADTGPTDLHPSFDCARRFQIYGASSASSVTPGDLVRLSGTVSEYASLETGLHLTEVVFPSELAVVSRGHGLRSIVLGVDRTPPGERIFVRDQLELKPGVDIEIKDGKPLEVEVKGLAFWESCVASLMLSVAHRRPLWTNSVALASKTCSSPSQTPELSHAPITCQTYG